MLAGRFQIRERLRRVLIAKQAHPQIQIRFIQTRLQLQHRPVLRNRLRVLPEQTVRQRQMEMRAIILWIFGDRFGEPSRRFLVSLPVERFHTFCLIIDALRQESGQKKPHVTLILTAYRVR